MAQRWDLKKEYKFTDNRKDEQDRGISLKSAPLTVLLQDSKEKSFMYNLIDTPGHPNFSDEVTCALRVSDGALLVVDVIEGVTSYVERLITECVKSKVKFVVVLNKLDRLVLELKLPPSDAYYKIKNTLDDINSCIKKLEPIHSGKQPYISPLNSNVIFSSTLFSCCFTIRSFAQRYAENLRLKTTNKTSTKFEKHS